MRLNSIIVVNDGNISPKDHDVTKITKSHLSTVIRLGSNSLPRYNYQVHIYLLNNYDCIFEQTFVTLPGYVTSLNCNMLFYLSGILLFDPSIK